MAKTLVGTVSSVSPDKTIIIAVNTRKTHPIYKKQYTVTSKFMAHDEENSCKVGDRVSIVETRPISARKRYKLDSILEKARLSKEDLKAIDADAPEKKEDSGKDDKKNTPAQTSDKEVSTDKEKNE